MSIDEKNTTEMAWEIVERDGSNFCPVPMKEPGMAGTGSLVFEAGAEPAFKIDFLPLPKTVRGRIIVQVIHVGKGNRRVAAKGSGTRKLLFERTPSLFELAEPENIFGLYGRDGLLAGKELYLLSQFDIVHTGKIFGASSGEAAAGTDVPMGLSIREQLIIEQDMFVLGFAKSASERMILFAIILMEVGLTTRRKTSYRNHAKNGGLYLGCDAGVRVFHPELCGKKTGNCQ
jgi:hypothetical protein